MELNSLFGRALRIYSIFIFMSFVTGCQTNNDLEQYKNIAQTQELSTAAGRGDIDEVDRLIQIGASLREPYSLQAAVLHSQYEMVDHLIRLGAPINGVGDIQSPLWYAVTHGDIKMVEKLIELGADVNWQINHMGTPLHSIAYTHKSGEKKKNSVAIAKILLENGANIDQIQNDIMFRKRCLSTALHAAVFSLDKDLVDLFITSGASLVITDLNGLTPKQCAQERLLIIRSDELRPKIEEIISILNNAEK